MSLNEIFDRIYHNLFSGNPITFQQIQEDIAEPTKTYFDENNTPREHNQFFAYFTPIWSRLLQNRQYFDAIKLWNLAINLSLNWENENIPNKIHKGTPFYFLGVSAILNNEFENGFLAMHQAMIEDKRLSGRRRPEAPAYWFVALDYTHENQFFRPKIEQIANYLSDRIEEYSNTRNGALTLEQLRRKFLRHSRLGEEVFLFVFSIFKLRKLIEETSMVFKENTFSSILHAKLLFDLTIILDKIIEYKNPRRRNPNARLVFADELIYISTTNRMANRRLLSFNTNNKIGDLNIQFNTNFQNALRSLLSRRFSINFTEIEYDFAIAYGIRNFGAHKIEQQKILYEKLPEISQSILNCLFYVIEYAYNYYAT